jgi:hypothetical protein
MLSTRTNSLEKKLGLLFSSSANIGSSPHGAAARFCFRFELKPYVVAPLVRVPDFATIAGLHASILTCNPGPGSLHVTECKFHASLGPTS